MAISVVADNDIVWTIEHRIAPSIYLPPALGRHLIIRYEYGKLQTFLLSE